MIQDPLIHGQEVWLYRKDKPLQYGIVSSQYINHLMVLSEDKRSDSKCTYMLLALDWYDVVPVYTDDVLY